MLRIFNGFVPASFYTPKFKPDTVIISNGVNGKRSDLPRFPGDTRFSTIGNSGFLIKGINYGHYSSQGSQAEFEHRSFGIPHYEIQSLERGGLIDNYTDKSQTEGSTIHIEAPLADSLLYPSKAVFIAKHAA